MSDLNENGKSIQFVNGVIEVPAHPVVPYISGDGCGPEIWLSTRQVVDFAIRSVYGSARSIEWMEVLAGQRSFDLSGSWLPEETLQAFRKYHIGIKGPLNTPIGEGIRSLNVALRKELDLYACLRPIKYYPGAPSPLRHPEEINITLFRENTEDVYSGIEFESGSAESQKLLGFLKTDLPQSYAKIRFPDSSALGIKPISREGSERIIRTAIEWALRNDRKTVTILHKGNIMKFTEGGFLNWGYALADSEFADRLYTSRQWKQSALRAGEAVANGELENAQNTGKLIVNDMIVDASFEWAITRPQEMDVLVTTNL
ncbi:MAG: isocitrate/isopropylmalate family dehydrogenase, partial [Chloroflexi bacterium]|nr:isocitrate/isopropylmalate family dehydrogenase [Chloroflexota bacterium]